VVWRLDRLGRNLEVPVTEIAARFGIARSTLYRTMLKGTG
jgi:DNA invertase Pin-like site-specific DNA recombinase